MRRPRRRPRRRTRRLMATTTPRPIRRATTPHRSSCSRSRRRRMSATSAKPLRPTRASRITTPRRMQANTCPWRFPRTPAIGRLGATLSSTTMQHRTGSTWMDGRTSTGSKACQSMPRIARPLRSCTVGKAPSSMSSTRTFPRTSGLSSQGPSSKSTPAARSAWRRRPASMSTTRRRTRRTRTRTTKRGSPNTSPRLSRCPWRRGRSRRQQASG
mmetsp:Transcript_73461/g.212573  ORF Transcript_73461/g.212573 Transcript_73461/m.212573 type:complete len:214 (+) Transcript_73461:542-1183(+)